MNHLLSANTRPREESRLRLRRIGGSGKNASEAGTRKWFFSWGEERAFWRQTEIDDSSTLVSNSNRRRVPWSNGLSNYDDNICYQPREKKKKGYFWCWFFFCPHHFEPELCHQLLYVIFSITNMWQKPTSTAHSTLRSKALFSWKLKGTFLTLDLCRYILMEFYFLAKEKNNWRKDRIRKKENHSIGCPVTASRCRDLVYMALSFSN